MSDCKEQIKSVEKALSCLNDPRMLQLILIKQSDTYVNRLVKQFLQLDKNAKNIEEDMRKCEERYTNLSEESMKLNTLSKEVSDKIKVSMNGRKATKPSNVTLSPLS